MEDKLTVKEICEIYKYSTYLVGAMSITAEKDGGIAQREEVEKELLLRNVFPINPAKLEKAKSGMSAVDAIDKIKGWVSSGKRDLLHKVGKGIWKGYDTINEGGNVVHIGGDLDYVKVSNWLTFVLNEKDKPCIEEDTQILMDDLTTKSIREIKEGDKIKGFKRINGKTKLITSIVLKKYYKGKKNTLLIKDSFGNEIITTPDHKFLTPNKKEGSIYESISDIDEGFSMPFTVQNDNYLKGWLIGYLQNDGNFYESKSIHRVSALSDKFKEINILYDILKHFNFNPKQRIIKKDNNTYYEVATYSIKDYEVLNTWRFVHENSLYFKKGWLAGAIDADGYYEKESIRYTQSIIHSENIKTFELYCNQLDITYSKNVRNILRRIFIKNRELNTHKEVCICLPKRFFAYIPSQLDYKRKKLNITIDKMRNFITSEKYCKLPVYDIITTSGNFIANGFIVHNCGTYFEVGVAIDHNIPIYIITNIPKKELSQSLILGIEAVHGEFFDNLNQYLIYLDEKYKLKRIEPKSFKECKDCVNFQKCPTEIIANCGSDGKLFKKKEEPK